MKELIDIDDYFPKELIDLPYARLILSIIRWDYPTYYNVKDLPDIFNSVMVNIYRCTNEVSNGTIRYFINSYIKSTKSPNQYSLDDDIDVYSELTLKDIIEDNYDFTCEVLNKELVREIKDILTEREWLIISLLYGLCKTDNFPYNKRNVSILLDIPITRLEMLERRIIKKLKRILKSDL